MFVPLSLLKAKRCKLAGPQYNWGPCVRKLLFTDYSRVSPMVDGVPAHGVMGSVYHHWALSGKSQLPVAVLGFKQALASLNLTPTDLWRGRISILD